MFDWRCIDSLDGISAAEWNALCDTDYPFIRHEFLQALELSGATNKDTGWQPQHLLAFDGERLVAWMPGYLKQHSYGEFVFDFQWAEAWQRQGHDYYPKWISAIPFSPVTGPRLCVHRDYNADVLTTALLQWIRERVSADQLSSWHLLFPEAELSHHLARQGVAQRKAVHFQWYNEGYGRFDDFLAAFNSRQRKNLRKERERVQARGIHLQRIEGRHITEELWDIFYHFYQITYLKRSGHRGYLNRDFFTLLGRTLPDQLLMVLARKDGQAVAGALNLKDSTTLYGRYWGCYEEFDGLHFETCYYQGIEYCIEQGLKRFDPGAQGEHKIQRGFRPVYTYSNHWIADDGFRRAIEQFLSREETHIAQYKADAERYLPFRQSLQTTTLPGE